MRVFPNGTGLSVALVAVFFAAWLSPSFGLEGGPLFPERLSLVAVFVIFLIQGWKLDLGGLRKAWVDRRTLVFLHAFIFFGALPLVWLASEWGLLAAVWSPGLIFLAILPTTISSCVVYTRCAGGDADAALGHATFSNLIGMLWVPALWGLLVVPGETDRIGVLDSLRLVLPDFLLMILFPCFLGWWARNKLSFALLPSDGAGLEKIPIGCILLLAYFSFCSLFAEFENDLFTLHTGVVAGIIFVWLLAQTILAWVVGGLVCLSRPSRVAFLFCGGQKSLALGLPLAQLLHSPDGSSIGLLVLPLALFHFGQLLLGAFLVEPLRRWTK